MGARKWARWILVACGIRVEADDLGEIQPKQAYVVMSNHQSVFDIVALVATLPLSFRFVAKRELTWIPFFGWGLIAAGHIVIDRSRNDRAVTSLTLAAERVRDGVSVIIFPEGTRCRASALRPFKSGGFHLASPDPARDDLRLPPHHAAGRGTRSGSSRAASSSESASRSPDRRFHPRTPGRPEAGGASGHSRGLRPHPSIRLKRAQLPESKCLLGVFPGVTVV